MKMRIADILVLAARASGITIAELRGTSRTKPIVLTRFAIYTVAREHGHSFPQIGKMLNKDHSTVVHGVRACQDWSRVKPEYAAFVVRLRADVAMSPGWLTLEDVAIASEVLADEIQASPKLRIPDPIILKPLPRARNVFAVTRSDEGETQGIDYRNDLRRGSLRLAQALAAAVAV